MRRLEEPDKGHAWIVALSASVVNGIMLGMARTIGILYVALILEYGATREEASLPFTVRGAIRFLAGPVVGALGSAFGIMTITFCGGVIAALGSALCFVAPSMKWIIFFWGGIHGLGFALSSTLIQVIINQWFNRHKSSASGLALSGATVGSLVFPVVLEYVIEYYGAAGCFLLLAGLFLNILPFSLFLRSPPWIEKPETYEKQRIRYNKQLVGGNLSKRESSEECSSLPNIHCKILSFGIGKKETTIDPSNKSIENTKKLFSWKPENQPKLEIECTMYRSKAIDDQFCKEENGVVMRGVSNSDFVPKEDNREICATETTIQQPLRHRTAEISFLKNIKSIPGLYLNPMYVLISISMSMFFFLLMSLLTIVVDFILDKGIPMSQQKFLILSLNIGDLFGRLGFGWIIDRKILSLPTFIILWFILQGVFLGLLPLVYSLTLCILVLAAHGVASGVIFVHMHVLIHKYVEEKDQTTALGCVGILSSVSTFGISPVIGHFRDNIGSYDGLFYIMSVCSVLTGILWLFVPLCKKSKHFVENET